jgi:imipenem/basic amino acid-specific outer membrane pore
MQAMKWSVIALAIAAGTSQMAMASSQSESNGFIEDADLTLLNRNFAFYRDFRNNDSDRQSYRNEWAHGFLTTFTSGFTQGVVGFGADAFGNVGLKLNSGGGTSGTGLLPVESDGQGQDEFGIAGGAVKARVSDTVLAFGQQRPESPVFATGDSRLLPSYATGTSLTMDEIENLSVQAGYFYSGNGTDSTNQDGELLTTYGETEFNNATYFGGDYAFSDTLSVGLHAAEFSDVWKQYYADLYHTFVVSDFVSLDTSLNYYKTSDTGRSEAGDISTDVYSAMLTLNFGAHSLSYGHQKVDGWTPFDYVSFDGSSGDSVWLANSVQYSDFNAPGMESWQARYDLDMESYGVPGLSFMARYISGKDADGTKADINGAYTGIGGDGKEWERNLEVKYVIQEGAAKDLSFRVRHATWRANSDMGFFGTAGATALDEIRIITEYPLDIL